jgi:hypothetical protein
MKVRFVLGRIAVAACVVAGSLYLGQPAQAAPSFDWRNATINLPWTAAPLPDGRACPGGRIQFTDLGDATPDQGAAMRRGFTYYVHVLGTADVTGDGKPDTVIRFACNDGPSDNQMGWYYLYTMRHKRPVLLDFITSSDEQANSNYAVLSTSARLSAVDVTHFVRGYAELVSRTFVWNSDHLTADRPLPIYPEADTAP